MGEWLLYGRANAPALPIADSDEASLSTRPKGRVNVVATVLASTELRGAAIVIPKDREWKPTVLGRIDMLSGNATKRCASESATKVVTCKALLDIYDATKATTAVLEKLSDVQGALRRRSGEGEADAAAGSAHETEDVD